MPKFTNQYTNAGRPLWEVTAEDVASKSWPKELPVGSNYSEFSRSMPMSINKDTGGPAEGTKWVNVPTVFERGKIIDNEEFLAKFYKENSYKDPITNRKLEFFDDLDKAIDAARNRSGHLLDK